MKRMEYFKMKYSVDEKVIGDYPQIRDCVKGYDDEAPHAIYEFVGCRDKFPTFTPKLDGMKLYGRAKRTDFLSFVYAPSDRFHVMSPKAKEILEQFNLCDYRFYPLGLYSKKKRYEYYCLNILSLKPDPIDYKNSVFVKMKNFHFQENKEEQVYVKNEKDWDGLNDKLWDEGWKICCTHFVLKSPFDWDLFYCWSGLADSDVYVSARLKDAIISAGLTGLEFSIADNLSIK